VIPSVTKVGIRVAVVHLADTIFAARMSAEIAFKCLTRRPWCVGPLAGIKQIFAGYDAALLRMYRSC
jgi:hypothetical protein